MRSVFPPLPDLLPAVRPGASSFSGGGPGEPLSFRVRIRAIPCRQRILHGAGALAVETAVGFLMLSRDARCDRPTHGQDIRSLSGSGAPARGRHGRNAFGRCPALRLPRRSGKGRNLRTGGGGSLSLLSGQDRSLVDKAIASVEGKISAGRTTKPRFLCYICKVRRLSLEIRR